MSRQDLQAQGERDLRERLLAEHEIRRAIEQIDKQLEKEQGARRQLLAAATRLTAEMAPELHAILTRCKETLGVEGPLETFVYPDPMFNAAAVRPERGRLLMMVSSGLLEGFDDDELSFVAGHEFGHWLFDHHQIPVGVLLGGRFRVSPSLVLQLFAWQRYAEISADRAGLICAGGLEAAAHALFKLASGLTGGRVKVRIDEFLAQVGDLQKEAESVATADERPRSDWFSSHPFSPLRLKAAQLFAASAVMTPGGVARDQLEAEVQELMTLMDPSYLQGRSEVAELMRRLLFAGGVAVAAASGEVTEESLEALEDLLGPGSIPGELKPDVIKADLPSRIEAVRAEVPVLRRAQVIRDLCVIARADGRIERGEVEVIREIAEAVGVDETMVDCVIEGGDEQYDTCPPAAQRPMG
jgi:tellurite resistance protein